MPHGTFSDDVSCNRTTAGNIRNAGFIVQNNMALFDKLRKCLGKRDIKFVERPVRSTTSLNCTNHNDGGVINSLR